MNFGVFIDSVQREAVRDCLSTHKLGDASESEDRERLVVVVGFEDVTHLVDGGFVLVQVVEGVEGSRRGLSAIGGCVVDSQHHRYLPSLVDDRHERRLLRDHVGSEVETASRVRRI